MNRITPILSLLVSGLALSACGPGKTAAPAPNVILIVMDTVRADRCSVNGYGRPTTPALEALAREGINFQNAWSPAGWTGPAHASMFTGLLPIHHGFLRGIREYLDQTATTVAERLLDAGYRTACVTNNATISAELGLDQGFVRFFPMYEDEGKYYPTAPESHRQALQWVDGARKEGKRFFLFINDTEAHYQYTPPAEFRESFRDPSTPPAEALRVSEFGPEVLFEHNFGLKPRSAADIKVMSDLYDAEIACLDRAIGEFIVQLRSSGLLENTLLIITSDHGENLGEHGLLDHAYSLHRTIRHVPLIVRLPGEARAGEAHNEIVRLEDICPTILEACGLPVPDGLDGKSLLRDLPGRISRAMAGAPDQFVAKIHRQSDGAFDPAPFLLEYRALFDGHHHWIFRSDGHVEIYDGLADPGETTPLEGIPLADPASSPFD
jgi:arylsulfatase A-like enzyme